MIPKGAHGSFANIFLALTFAVGAFVFSGCSEKASSGQTVTIPRVIVNCQTPGCRTNMSPLVVIVITTSSCSPSNVYWGAAVSKSAYSVTCTSVAGCYREPTEPWYSGATGSSTAPTTTMSSGTYTICACLNYSSGALPYASCDQTGELDNVYIDGSTGLQTISSWH